MTLTDPVPYYDEIRMILLPFTILVSFSIGIFYIWRYRKLRALNTLLWAAGFVGVGIGMGIDYLIKYIFYDYFVLILPTVWDYSLFTHIGAAVVMGSITIFTFLGGIFKKKVKKGGIILTSVLSIGSIIILIINSFTGLDSLDVASWVTRILGFYIVIFFTYISFKYKNYRALSITIGLLLAVISGILMKQYSGALLGLIGNFLVFAFYIFIGYGLFYLHLRKKQE
jgi:hypothetical protein